MTGPPAMAAALRHRRFRVLFASQVVSSVGDWLDYLALIVLVTYVWDQGAGALAAVSVATAVPLVLLAPVAGAVADRTRDRKAVLIGCDVARAALVLGFLAAPGLPVLLALVVLKVSFSALFNPAYQSTLRSVVPERDMLSAMSLTVFANQAAKVAGPALSGLVVALWGVRAAFVADAATFVVSGLLLCAVRLPKRSAREEAAADGEPGAGHEAEAPAARGKLWAETVEGVAFIARTPALIAVIGSMAATLFLVLAFDTLSPLAMRELAVGEQDLGYVVAAVGLGAVLGTLAISQWGTRVRPFVLLGAAQLVVGALVGVIGIGLAVGAGGHALLWTAVAFGVGFAAAGIMVVFPYVLHRETPQELIGRVTSTANAFPVLLQLAAPPLGALLAGWFSVGFVFRTAGAVLCAVGVVVWIYGRGEKVAGDVSKDLEGAHGDAGSTGEPGHERGGESDRGGRNLDLLRGAGFPVDQLPDGQREALSCLSDEEVATLIDVQSRIQARAPEVEAHSMEPIIGGVLF
ncbi:MFS transporter [Streptomyces formicae]|uniref:Transporter, putative n=1 Tax=Streptomyces formicae TaxID=1616117 RepID=A0A291QKN1_9ACTN|nr:MFS transporter [Streptomyces formicae]ATL32005.1 transporter, putative [Streptomyces formicae]